MAPTPCVARVARCSLLAVPVRSERPVRGMVPPGTVYLRGISFSFVADKSACGAHPSTPIFFLCVGLAHAADKSANVARATI